MPAQKFEAEDKVVQNVQELRWCLVLEKAQFLMSFILRPFLGRFLDD